MKGILKVTKIAALLIGAMLSVATTSADAIGAISKELDDD